MIDAKSKFREGFIMLRRPFDFSNVQPLQPLTILWAYSEAPTYQRTLSEKGQEEVEMIRETRAIGFFSADDKNKYIEDQLEKLYSNPTYWKDHYKGEIVQSVVDGETCRFYPEEYNVITSERLQEIMEEEGYHVVCHPQLLKNRHFTEEVEYLRSRGIEEHIAKKWVSLGYKDLVIYKPYYELLTMFCRPNEIIADDPFYIKEEGIDFEELKELKREQRGAFFKLN